MSALSDMDNGFGGDYDAKKRGSTGSRSTAVTLDAFGEYGGFGGEPLTTKSTGPAYQGEAAPLVQEKYSNYYQQRAADLQDKFDINKSTHPFACIFTCVFKFTALFIYMFVGHFMTQIPVFIICVLLTAFDFWVVKNVTGRLLVGLRWWTKIKDDGTEEWIFESRNQKVEPNLTDSRFFWWSQIGALSLWSLMSIFCIFGMKIFWGTCCAICWSLTSTNLWAYYKCSKEYDRKLKDLVKGAGMLAAQSMLQRLF